MPTMTTNCSSSKGKSRPSDTRPPITAKKTAPLRESRLNLPMSATSFSCDSPCTSR